MHPSSKMFEQWLEAAYLYYIRPDLDPSMEDWEWDNIAKVLEHSEWKHPLKYKFIDEDGTLRMFSAAHLKEKDYPAWIRSKHSTLS